MKLPSLPRLGLAAAVIILASAVIFPIPFELHANTSLKEAQAKVALAMLRRSLHQGDLFKLPSELGEVSKEVVPIVLTVWSRGVRYRVFQTAEEPLGQALENLAGKLKKIGDRVNDPRLRLQLDFAVAEGWIPQDGVLASLAFVEGRDGVSGVIEGERIYLPPSELVRNNKYGSFKPLPDYDGKFRIGVDLVRVAKTVLNQGKRLGIPGDEVSDFARFRSLTVVEGEDLSPRRLLKGTVRRPNVTRARVEAAVIAGADYLTGMLRDDGIFRYYYNPVLDRDEKGEYNWPRHAGVTYSLALVGRVLKKPAYVGVASRALVRFEKQLGDGPDGSKCLQSRGKCYLGSSALGLLALAEYRIASGDDRFDDMARKVARFLVSMQKEDGFFYHDWYPKRGIDKELMKLYASQQAVFALARYAKALGDEDALEKAVFGMDYLAGPYWDHFLGSYFFGQEHWTCLAAEEVYAARPKPEYAELCHGIGVHYENITHNPGETPFIEDVGGMSVTHLFTPHLGGTATASEAMVSSVLLGDAIGLDTSRIREQLRVTYGFLIQGQVTADDTFWIRHPEQAMGGVYETQTKPKIRIDNVQHAISAMVRGLDFLPVDSKGAPAAAKKDYVLKE
ncbi:MAG: hypothetical protein GY854_02600 [Deltaproteobacteria bacterium]|nr:hypothetical protein [Deltaproteobacteria bacterium]